MGPKSVDHENIVQIRPQILELSWLLRMQEQTDKQSQAANVAYSPSVVEENLSSPCILYLDPLYFPIFHMFSETSSGSERRVRVKWAKS